MKSGLVLLGLTAGALALSACATAGNLVPTDHMPGRTEAIHAVAFSRDVAAFRVTSNGCTEKDDIKPFITKLKSRTVITLRRLDEDYCSSHMRDGVLLKWSFAELGLEPGAEIEVNNPYATPGRVQISDPTWTVPDGISGT